MMNIQQLSNSIDSLDKNLNIEKNITENYTDKFNLKLSTLKDTF